MNAGVLVIYEPPPYTDAAPEFELEVNGKKVYTSRAADFASFSFSYRMDVKVSFAAHVYNHESGLRTKALIQRS